MQQCSCVGRAAGFLCRSCRFLGAESYRTDPLFTLFLPEDLKVVGSVSSHRFHRSEAERLTWSGRMAPYEHDGATYDTGVANSSVISRIDLECMKLNLNLSAWLTGLIRLSAWIGSICLLKCWEITFISNWCWINEHTEETWQANWRKCTILSYMCALKLKMWQLIPTWQSKCLVQTQNKLYKMSYGGFPSSVN